jgi:hypothetical protein
VPVIGMTWGLPWFTERKYYIFAIKWGQFKIWTVLGKIYL